MRLRAALVWSVVAALASCATVGPAGWHDRQTERRSRLARADFDITFVDEGFGLVDVRRGAFVSTGTTGTSAGATGQATLGRTARAFEVRFRGGPAVTCEQAPADRDTWFGCRSNDGARELSLGPKSSCSAQRAGGEALATLTTPACWSGSARVGADVFQLSRGSFPKLASAPTNEITWLDERGRVVLAAELGFPPVVYDAPVTIDEPTREALVLLTGALSAYETLRSDASW